MEEITTSKQIFIRLINAESEINLSPQFKDEIYFNTSFRLFDYSLGEFERKQSDFIFALSQPDIEFNVVFDGDDQRFVETILTTSDKSSTNQENSSITMQVMHVIHLPANDAMKLRNIALTKTNLELYLTIFFSIDSILTAEHQLEDKKSAKVISHDFSLLNHTK